MKLFEQTHRFDHPWDTVTMANYRKYPNDLANHVISVDILSREVDPTSGLLVTERLLGCKQGFPPIVNRVVGSLSSNSTSSSTENSDSESNSSKSSYFKLWGSSTSESPKPITDIAYFREVSVLDPKTQKYIAVTTNLSLRKIMTVEETCIFEPDQTDLSKTVFTQRAAVSVGNTPVPVQDTDTSEIRGASQLKSIVKSSNSANTPLSSFIASLEKNGPMCAAKSCVSSSWQSLTGFVEEVCVSRFRSNAAVGRKGLEMVVEKVKAEAKGIEDRIAGFGDLRHKLSQSSS